jgi:hypothetical protein
MNPLNRHGAQKYTYKKNVKWCAWIIITRFELTTVNIVICQHIARQRLDEHPRYAHATIGRMFIARC